MYKYNQQSRTYVKNIMRNTNFLQRNNSLENSKEIPADHVIISYTDWQDRFQMAEKIFMDGFNAGQLLLETDRQKRLDQEARRYFIISWISIKAIGMTGFTKKNKFPNAFETVRILEEIYKDKAPIMLANILEVSQSDYDDFSGDSVTETEPIPTLTPSAQ